MSLLQDSHFVVAVSFVLFFGLLAYLGVHKFLGRALDEVKSLGDRKKEADHALKFDLGAVETSLVVFIREE